MQINQLSIGHWLQQACASGRSKREWEEEICGRKKSHKEPELNDVHKISRILNPFNIMIYLRISTNVLSTKLCSYTGVVRETPAEIPVGRRQFPAAFRWRPRYNRPPPQCGCHLSKAQRVDATMAPSNAGKGMAASAAQAFVPFLSYHIRV